MRRLALLAALALALPGPAAEAQQVQRERIHFERGHSGTTIRDRIAGRGSHEYLLGVREGQMLQVRLESAGNAVAFNVFEPGKRPGEAEALFRGEVSGDTMEVRTSQSGDYLIQVFQNRAAARRGERSEFTLHVAVTGGAPGGQAAAPPRQDSVTRAGAGAFDATAEIPCAVGTGAPMGRCPAGVARGPGGEATVLVTLPDGRKRALFFERGRLAGTDASQADGAGRPQVSREADLNIIRLGRERYEVPDAFVQGG